jgi:hypothetical protein
LILWSRFFSYRISPQKSSRKEVNNLNPHSLETTDIFRGAFFLCQGGKLADVRLKEDARKIVSFLIEGEGIDQLDVEYRNGQAMVNPLQFRESLNHLRDILFNTLREGRTRDDRKRKDRRVKKKH